jgi:predicted exporter
MALADLQGQAETFRPIFDRRYALLLPSWLGERRRQFGATAPPGTRFSPWLAERAAADLEGFLARPEAMPMQALVARDPLLLVPGLIDRERGLDLPKPDAGGSALVWARITDSPFSAAGQQPVFSTVEAALAKTRASFPGVGLRWSGINRIGAANRAQIEHEIRTLNVLSVAVVLGIAACLVRRLSKLIHLVPVIGCSLLGAWSLSTLVFPRIHILVGLIGSLLAGVAIDYGFYIYMQPPLFPGEPYGARLRRVMKALLASCLTTVIGFSLLLFSDLPFIREVGFFVSAGLLCALGAAILYFSQIPDPYLEGRRFDGRRRRCPWVASRSLVWALLAATALAGTTGLARLQWRDDVRDLEIPMPGLLANERELRTLFGDVPGSSVVLTYGSTPAEARANLQKFTAYEAAREPGVSAASFGLVFPTREDWLDEPALLSQLGGFEGDFRLALIRHGFDADAFASFHDDWEKARGAAPGPSSYDRLYADLGRELPGPLAQSYNAGGALSWFVSVVARPDLPRLPADLRTVNLNQLQTLDQLFTRYRWSALRLSMAGLALVIASVFLIYPFRTGLRIALIPSGSCCAVFGLFGLLGLTLNLFHLLGAFLGVCLSHNYSIFSSETARSGAAPPTPVRLSALCAASSFGVLAFSRVPVVHALGMTVALIVLTALACIEAGRLVGGGRPGS